MAAPTTTSFARGGRDMARISEVRDRHAPVAIEERRRQAAHGMLVACAWALGGALLLAFALRRADRPWLFPLGGVPLLVGVARFAHAVWQFLRD
jgi:hypothetical protein